MRNKSEVVEVQPPASASPELKVELHPLGKANFESTIRLHNVMPQELGAALWALTWGGQPHLRHALGMGKSFGYGQVQATVIGLDVRPNARASEHRTGAADRPLDERVLDFTAKFMAFMGKEVPPWDTSAEMVELLAMADPDRPQATKTTLKPLTLTVGVQNGNEFTTAKQGRQVLPKYSSLGN